MLPISHKSSPEKSLTKPIRNRTKTPPDLSPPPPPGSPTSIIIFTKSYFLSPLSLHPLRSTCLIFSLLLLLQLLLLSIPRHLSPFSSTSRLHSPSPSSPPPSPSPPLSLLPSPSLSLLPSPALAPAPEPKPTDNNSQCPLGRFYVYDLPPEFNADLQRNCHNLSVWGSRCRALSNSGLGPEANTPIVPANLSRTWYWTDQFALEIIFHNRVMGHPCRTPDPESASAFYVPFYGGLASEKYLWGGSTHQERDRKCQALLTWIQSSRPWFNRSNGWDHFLTLGRITWDFRRSKSTDWGSNCIYQPSMRNITRLLIERDKYDYFDVGVPYPTGFHPETPGDVATWQRFVLSRPRPTLFSFAGGTRGLIKNDFRLLLMSQCRDAGAGACRVVDCGGTKCSNGTAEILNAFLGSEFCLQPRGDSFTRRSIFDCMVAGSIPVFFWQRSAYYQYQWFLPGEPQSYSVFIHRDQVKNGTVIKDVLAGFTKEEVRGMREKVVEYIPKLIYAKPGQGLGSVKDAVDVAVDVVLGRMKQHKERGYKW